MDPEDEREWRRGGTNHVTLPLSSASQILADCRNLGGKNTAAMKPGERIIICTPGGGGYGTLDEGDEKDKKKQ